MAAEVIDLAMYASLRAPSGTERAEAVANESAWFQSSRPALTTDFLAASALRKLDEESSVGRLFELIEAALLRLEACLEFLETGDNLAADDEFMGCKKIFSEMLMFRDVSEPVG